MNIFIHGRPFQPEAKSSIQSLVNSIQKHEFGFQISESFRKILNDADIRLPDTPQSTSIGIEHNAQLALSLGGDGSFLETIGLVARQDIPVLGINYGRLGFLADLQPVNFDLTFEKLKNKQYEIDTRMMLQANTDVPLFDADSNFALNEIVVSKTDTSSMIVVHAYINGKHLNSYWADGLMVSTPTGSTGYNLSCGGPLVIPTSENFIITPVCPHNLFVRPIIVDSNAEIRLKVESRSKNFLLSMDSRAKIVADDIGDIAVKKEPFKAKLVKMDGMDFLNTLRKKLRWGEDLRNRI